MDDITQAECQEHIRQWTAAMLRADDSLGHFVGSCDSVKAHWDGYAAKMSAAGETARLTATGATFAQKVADRTRPKLADIARALTILAEGEGRTLADLLADIQAAAPE